MDQLDPIPPYSIRESKKAKRVILIVSPADGLKVVIPSGFDRHEIPRIISRKREWIRKAFWKIREQCAEDLLVRLPEVIDLKAIHRRFTVEYASRPAGPLELHQSGSSKLLLRGAVTDSNGCRTLLQRWLQQQGRLHLIPWLERLSARTGLSYRRVQIRGQKSRWGSCSTNKTISLNRKLLFLAPELVHYIIIHELCHIAQPNHSRRFWSLVAELEPTYRDLEARINDASRNVPGWAR